MYKIEATRAFRGDLERLDRGVAFLILKKIEWLAENPEALRSPLKYAPKDLKGLHKYRVGDYRLFLWINHQERRIVLYRVRHRREAYRHL